MAESDDQHSEVANVWVEWKESVNMSASTLEKWLDTEESKAAGQKEGGESVGHASGRGS